MAVENPLPSGCTSHQPPTHLLKFRRMKARDLVLAPQLSGEQIRTFLSRFGIEDAEAADRHLQEISRITGQPVRLAKTLDALLQAVAHSVDPDACLRNLETFFSALPSPGSFLSLIESNPVALQLLTEILGASPYLTQSLCRNPEYFYWLIEQQRFEKIYDKACFQKEVALAVRPFDSSPAALEALRRLVRREKLRIGAQDLSNQYGLEQVTEQISLLVEVVLQQVFELLAREMLSSLSGFVVLALGKLGGKELNFSSDIDLFYMFEAGRGEQERMLQFARQYTRVLGQFSDEGRLFRVDLRLRPMGSSGDIAYPVDATRSYFQTWADTTDRLAFLKCRPVAGDIRLGTTFLESLQGFIFKKYLDFAALEEIRWIKKKIDREMQRQGTTFHNIKLGRGGIREIEFFTQSLQMLYGGQHPQIRTPNTLDALRRLLDGGFIEFEVFEHLSGAYHFLRALEHKLQLVHDRQTHSLPDDPRELLRCARRLGYRSTNRATDEEVIGHFQSDLHRHSYRVRDLFTALLDSDKPETELQEVLLNLSSNRDKLTAYLTERETRSPDRIAQGVELLLDAPSFPHAPRRMRNLLANLIPSLLPWCDRMSDPRLFFSRLDRFCEALGSRVPLLTELLENPLFLESLSRVFLSGEYLSETLIQNPELIDAVASPTGTRGRMPAQGLPADDCSRETGREVLRLYKKREEFKIALAFLANSRSVAIRPALTRLADNCVRFAVQQALQSYPSMRRESFAIVALGKLGGQEMTFHSDLDLVFLVNEERAQQPRREFAAFLQLLRDELQAYTDQGRAYEVDFRLRPEGKQGSPVVSLFMLRRYFRDRAQPWERLAWVKARCLVDHGGFPSLDDLVYDDPFSAAELDSLKRLRERKEKELSGEKSGGCFNLKIGRGSLFDIQFLIQTLQIQYKVKDKNSLSAMEKLVSEERLDKGDFRRLREALRFYYRLESMQELVDPRQPDLLSIDPGRHDLAAFFLGYRDGTALLAKYRKTAGQVREIYHRAFEELQGTLR